MVLGLGHTKLLAKNRPATAEHKSCKKTIFKATNSTMEPIFVNIFLSSLIPLANSKNCGQRKTKSINASNNVRLTRKYILKGKNFEKVYAFRKN